MTDREYERWIELQDRLASGAALSAAERELCARMASDPVCARELQLLDELSHLDAQPEPGAREREEAVLAAIWGQPSQSEATHAAQDDEARLSGTHQVTRSMFRTRAVWKLGATLVAAAAVALSVGTGIGYWQNRGGAALEQQPSRVELVYASGDVRVQAETATFGQLLAEGNVVEVNEGAACLAIDPGIDVCLGKHSKLRVTRTAVADRRVDLLEGDVTAAIDPQPAGARFSVVADGVWSTAVGTAFSVSRKDSGVVTAVLSGKVLVGAKDKQKSVDAHQLARIAHDKTTLTPLARAEEAAYWAAIKTTALWRDPGTATLRVIDGQARATVWLDGEAIGGSPLASLIPAGEHRITLMLADGSSLERTFMVAAGKSWQLDVAAELATLAAAHDLKARVAELPSMPKAHVPTTTTHSVVSASELLAQARQQMRQSDWQGAVATYRQLRTLHASTPEAMTALVPLAQLSMDRLQQPASALRDLDLYLAQGGGPLTQEARYLRIAALRASGKHAMANDAVRAFLDDYGDSFQAETLRRELRAAAQQPVEPKGADQ